MLQISHADDLQLLRVIDGGQPTEMWFHKKFWRQKISGEWFRFVDEMMMIKPPPDVEREARKRRDEHDAKSAWICGVSVDKYRMVKKTGIWED